MSENLSYLRQLAREYVAENKATEWFEVLYSQAQQDPTLLPWAHLQPNPNLTEWLQSNSISGSGKTALVIGCGLGDDAEELCNYGFEVVAFDVAPSAIEWCQQRFSSSSVDYAIADLLHPPMSWYRSFDFVFESYTLQALPLELRLAAMQSTADFVAPGGMLLIIARSRNEEEELSGPPWPLTEAEVMEFTRLGLASDRFEEYWDKETPPVRRFRITFKRP
ncbi:class I SAM-dependent methyltransferase [Roseofilum casamattae]|uniref:Class I SAM-dependent methyltransferase n=1 Tax=Roseofilum casamattae BLCC-M143 TaxID=3022442 RepID=A0ABT7C0A2_9CYAN|nr:class I SAM-dependent methyltransferase [Roseofilum casamattae]MDJ1184872.1 class I SAM-dependent methyltransferase [Roseofilum casamattae BLCC-M143]